MRVQRTLREPRRRHIFVFWGVATGAAFLPYQLVATVIEELPRLIKELR